MGIMDAFFEPAEGQHRVAAAAAAGGIKIEHTAINGQPTMVMSGSAPTETYTHLLSLVLSRDSSYTKLRRADEAMRKVIADPDQRFNAALAAMAGNGLDPAQIAQGLTLHEQELESQRGAFDKTLQGKMDQVREQNAEVSRIDEQVASLQLRRSELAQSAGVLERSIRDATTEFKDAADAIAAELAKDRMRLGGGK